MDAIIWLATANIIIWLGIAFYAAFIAVKQRNLALRLKQLEILQNDPDE